MKFAFLLILSATLWGQEPPPSQPPPSSGESSSRDTMIDLTPPLDDRDHPGADIEESSDVIETRPYNPHKAAKDIEVGDYYFKSKNVKAAISRYREALDYKPYDGEATLKLAVALEKAGEMSEAAGLYQGYLKLMPEGPYALPAQKGVERLRQYLPEDKLAFAMESGDAAFAKGAFAEASAQFQRALDLDPKSGPARYRLAQSLEVQGELPEALAAYYEYMTHSPGGSFADDAMAAIARLKRKGVATSRSSGTPPSKR